MDKPTKEKIQNQMREYHIAKQAFTLKNVLDQKREEIDRDVQELSQIVEDEKLDHHKKQPNEQLPVEITEKIELLKSVRNTRKELDHKLDDYEMFSAEMLICLRDDLIQSILLVYPEQSKKYASMKDAINNYSEIIDKLASFQTTFQEIEKHLSMIDNEREGVKRQSIFRYIFGTSPNYAITKSLLHIRKLTDEMIKNDDLKYFSKDFLELAKELHSATLSRWGWKKIDEVIVPLRQDVEIFNEKLSKLQAQEQAEMDVQVENLNQWIEQLGS